MNKPQPPFKVVHGLSGRRNHVVGTFDDIEKAREAANSYAEKISAEQKHGYVSVTIYDAGGDIPLEKVTIEKKNPAAVALGKIKSAKKARSSAVNGTFGGRPRKPKRVARRANIRS